MSIQDLDLLNPKDFVIIKGAKVHNLKSVSLAIPRKKFTVITGLSGSGKSSLALDTLYAEGQRRYVESLSSYARQFLGRLDKPEVEYIRGISPAVAIEQKVVSRSSRSTVGTSTEIYDYLKLLYARVGRTISPISGNEVKKHTVTDIVNFLFNYSNDTRVTISFPLKTKSDRTTEKQLELLVQQGFSRAILEDEIVRIDELIDSSLQKNASVEIIVDRISLSQDDELKARIADSAEMAFFEGQGDCLVRVFTGDTSTLFPFSNRFELDGMSFEEPIPDFFSFNNPMGACRTCEGFGSVIGIDHDLVIPNPKLSVFEEAIVCWKGEKMGKWREALVSQSHKFDFPIHTPIADLSPEQYELLWTGNKHFKGLNAFFAMLEENTYKIQYRVMLSRYRGKTPCGECKGTKIRKDAGYVKIDGVSILELLDKPLDEVATFFKNIKLDERDGQIASRLLIEITNRLDFLLRVGLSYLTLNRSSNTLSGGESQRINLATSLGSSLVGSMYILDEPSIGLHSRDTKRLIGVLEALRDLGNTVIVVEHDEEIMRAADHIIDMGPGAGIHGGEVIYNGSIADLKTATGLTADYLNHKIKIETPQQRRHSRNSIFIKDARANNLKNIEVKFPLNVLNVVTGVSGSGKSTLISDILFPAIKKHMGEYSGNVGAHSAIGGDLNKLTAIEFVDQNPIGKSSRSNPVTYVKAFDEIRALLSNLPHSKANGFKPAMFSFNVPGGRCDECEGEGTVTIEMQFMADIKLKCDHCQGKRFKDEILEVRYEGKNISDILDMTVDEAIDFFQKENSTLTKRLISKLSPLQDVGLGYIGLGQPSNTLSGGEAQRVKLASFLSKGDKAGHTLFIFDEPTTGLHFHDVKKLLDSFNLLIKQGHSLIIIEHDLDLIKNADWIVDLGPDGGIHGGEVVFQGTPEELVQFNQGFTSTFLKDSLN